MDLRQTIPLFTISLVVGVVVSVLLFLASPLPAHSIALGFVAGGVVYITFRRRRNA